MKILLVDERNDDDFVVLMYVYIDYHHFDVLIVHENYFLMVHQTIKQTSRRDNWIEKRILIEPHQFVEDNLHF